MGLQVLYVGLAIYGWYAWGKGEQGAGQLRVSRASRLTLAAAFGAGIAATLALGIGLGRLTDEALPFTDAAVTAVSLIAQWMQTRKLIENWWLWLAVDVAYVAINLSQGLLPTAGLYAIFTALAVAGLRAWRRTMEEA
jgi:nicotinamide mononucleotide transporter